MSPESKSIAGILLIIITTIEFGGASLLWMIRSREPGYMDNPVRQALFRAGHAHAGVLVILALVGLLYIDGTTMSEGFKSLARNTIALAPLFVSAGFFLSIIPPKATRPNGLIALVYLGALSLAVGVVTLGIGLLRAA